MAAGFTPAAIRGAEVDFGFGTLARVLAPAGGATPALFLCGGAGAHRGVTAPLAEQCVAAGFTAVTLEVAAQRGVADDAWLAGAARWVKDNQASGRLAPGLVFLGGENQGAAGAFAWAADLRRALGTTRLRAVVGLNGSGLRGRAPDIAALTRGEATSIVLISEGGADESLALGRELSALDAPFELHLLPRPEPGVPADALRLMQMQRSLQPPTP